MREIKFRAWVLGKMYEVKNLEWDWGHLTITTDGGWIALPDPKAHLMEFTGLHDKNGVELYEGDVVCANWRDSNGYKFRCTGVVKFKDGSFCIVSSRSTLYRWMDYGEIEVIGNIHENPELLESPDA